MIGESEKLAERLRDRGFTPGVRDLPELLGWWQKTVANVRQDEQRRVTKLVVQALGRADRPVASMLLRDLWQAEAVERALRVRVLSRIAARVDLPELEQALARALADEDARVVRSALRAIGKLNGDAGERFEDAVVARLRRAALPEQRAAAEALGKIGSHAAVNALRAQPASDGDLTRRCARAIVLIERRQRRGEPTEILTASPLPEAASIVLRCRPGAEHFAKEQACALLGLSDQDVEIDPLGVAFSFTGSLERLIGVRIALDATLAFELLPDTDLSQRIVKTLAQPRVLSSMRAWTDGALRFRLSFLDGSARRAIAYAAASSLAERGVPMHNDSREAPWSVEVDIERERLHCAPRIPELRATDQRAQVPAASHRTLAALMAWVARPRKAEVIWDPFCGSGSELIECARLEPSVKLYGTDQSASALATARQNLKAAGLTIESGSLVQADALQTLPGGADADIAPTLIITNPPMGRRANSGYGVHQLLKRFVVRAADLLPPGGRLVWVTPAANVSADAGREAGLQVKDHGPVDLAGLLVHLQVMVR